MKHYYSRIIYVDTTNGKGIGNTIFLSGCSYHCKGCFNKEVWDYNHGNELTDDVINEFVDKSKKEYINRISILGGEPLDDFNKYSTYKIIKKINEENLKLNIWIWSGSLFESLMERSKSDYIIDYILSHTNVLVDGRFDITKLCYGAFSGSSNQRVIDVKKSLREGNVVTYEK